MTDSPPAAELPPAFDFGVYRALHSDLQAMSDEHLQRHYLRYGLSEGRRANSIADRSEFAALALRGDVLELRPSCAPMLRGPRVSYFDLRDSVALALRAQERGRPTEGVPALVEFVSATGNLSVVDRTFDAVLGVHVAEGQPDLVRHLQGVERLLKPGGLYLLIVADQRFSPQHFLPTSTIADVVDAWYTQRTTHSLRTQIDDAALTTNVRASQHWAGRHGAQPRVAERARDVLERYQREPNPDIDMYDWYFTPSSFEQIVTLLGELGHTKLRVARVYPALKDTDEFWAVLECPAA